MPVRFRLENSADSDNVLTAVLAGKELTISVSEEKAVDSYNETFECSYVLKPTDVLSLKDWLNSIYS